jgi:osmotically-inducible protein OsmY
MSEVDDDILSYRGRFAIRRNVPIVISQPKVIVHRGHVTLKGHALVAFMRSRAERVVRHLEGVKGVTNEITVSTNQPIQTLLTVRTVTLQPPAACKGNSSSNIEPPESAVR